MHMYMYINRVVKSHTEKGTKKCNTGSIDVLIFSSPTQSPWKDLAKTNVSFHNSIFILCNLIHTIHALGPHSIPVSRIRMVEGKELTE